MRYLILALLAGCVPSLYTSDFGDEWTWEAPENTWEMVEPPEQSEVPGFYEGNIVPDFRLVDQHGDTVSMWQFYGNLVLLDVSTMWCSPCQELGKTTQETWEYYADKDFIYMTVLQENVEGEVPTLEDINSWVDSFGIEQPVLADGEKTGTGDAVVQGQYPAILVIDRDLRVLERVTEPTDAAVHAAIDKALGL